MNMVCHSGGAEGADIIWETECSRYGIPTIAYSFHNHVQYSNNQKILTLDELEEGFDAVCIAENALKRGIHTSNIFYPYVKNLLCRNWFQVKNSDAIFAIGKFASKEKSIVSGGTGWAVQMAVDNKKEIYFFDQEKTHTWHKYSYEAKSFKQILYIPKLTENFAGIGTRDINKSGINAIQVILKQNFENL